MPDHYIAENPHEHHDVDNNQGQAELEKLLKDIKHDKKIAVKVSKAMVGAYDYVAKKRGKPTLEERNKAYKESQKKKKQSDKK